ncbi:MAG: preprotein translocase subunit SecE [Phycisphaerales bacterium]|nr:preprotein translocase subunit SecE [Phycisphaerales bacterium]
MSSAIYKSGQGYWVRLMSAIAFGVVVVLGLNWLWGWLATMSFDGVETVYVQVGAILVFAAIFGGIGFHVIGKRKRTVDFFVATEGEMKKVNWSSKRELNRSTWAVIAFTIGLAFYCFVFDKIFFVLFYWVGVLDASSTS